MNFECFQKLHTTEIKQDNYSYLQVCAVDCVVHYYTEKPRPWVGSDCLATINTLLDSPLQRVNEDWPKPNRLLVIWAQK